MNYITTCVMSLAIALFRMEEFAKIALRCYSECCEEQEPKCGIIDLTLKRSL